MSLLRRSAVAASNAAAVPSVGGQLLTWTSVVIYIYIYIYVCI